MKNGIDFEINSLIPDILEKLPEEIENAMLKASIELHGHVVKKLSGQRSGFEYNVPGTGTVVAKEKTLENGRVFHYSKLEGAVTYKASAPGEAPASRLGDLRTSYQFKVEGKGFEANGIVGTPLPYAVYLEKGTSNMAPRPHLQIAYEENWINIQRHFEGLIKS